MVERIGKSYETYWSSVEDTPRSQQNRRQLELFLEWSGYSYEGLFNACLDARRSPDPRDMAAFASKIVNYYRYVKTLKWKGRPYALGSIKGQVKAINQFLATNGLRVEYTRQQKKEMVGRTVKTKDCPTREELKTILGATTSVKNAAIIMCLKDSGMAVGDLSALNVGDLGSALDNGDKFAQIDYRRAKTGIGGSPCFGPESLDALRAWMKWRHAEGFPCGPEQPLFIVTTGRNKDRYTKQDVMRGVRLSGKAMASILLEVFRRSGVTNGRVLSAHALRVFNSSQLESAGVNRNIVYRIQARQIPDSGRAYSRGEVMSSYQKAYDSLAVGKMQIVEIQDARVAELEAQVRELGRLVKALDESRAKN